MGSSLPGLVGILHLTAQTMVCGNRYSSPGTVRLCRGANVHTTASCVLMSLLSLPTPPPSLVPPCCRQQKKEDRRSVESYAGTHTQACRLLCFVGSWTPVLEASRSAPCDTQHQRRKPDRRVLRAYRLRWLVWCQTEQTAFSSFSSTDC